MPCLFWTDHWARIEITKLSCSSSCWSRLGNEVIKFEGETYWELTIRTLSLDVCQSWWDDAQVFLVKIELQGS